MSRSEATIPNKSLIKAAFADVQNADKSAFSVEIFVMDF